MKNQIIALSLLAFVAAGCSSSGSSPETEESDSLTASQLAFLEASNESVSVAELTPIDLEKLENEGASTVIYNTELDCNDGPQQTLFNFDKTTSVASAELCDGTSLQASYKVEQGVLVLFGMELDGRPSDNPGADFWGLLATQPSNAPSACFASYQIDEEIQIAGAAVLREEQIIPPVSGIEFDCSEEAYLFYGASVPAELLTSG